MKRAELLLVREDQARVQVTCQRLQVQRTVREHLQCPYCFGAAEDVKSSLHARFCDFTPGVDPVSFGFPENLRRYR